MRVLMNVAESSPRSKNVFLSIKAEVLAEILNIQTTVRKVILQHSRQKNYIYFEFYSTSSSDFPLIVSPTERIFKAGIIQ